MNNCEELVLLEDDEIIYKCERLLKRYMSLTHVVADVEEHLKSGGKQWQATPKNLPRMQCTRAIPVA